MINRLAKGGENGVSQLCKGFSVIGSIGLISMMLLVTVDVGGRFFFDKALIGAYELVEYLMIIVIFLGIPYGQINKQHVNVELFTAMLKGRVRAAVESITYLATIVIAVLLSWASVMQTIDIWKAKQSSQVLLIPQWPIATVMAIGCIVYTLALVVDFVRSLVRVTKRII
jgi:TRAP-type C4-dicarboxylate transport system permease small subunit